MAEELKKYFPMIRTREEIYTEIGQKKELLEIYRGWNEEQQNTFLDYCTGQRGVRVLSDSVFKEVLDPLRCPERGRPVIRQTCSCVSTGVLGMPKEKQVRNSAIAILKMCILLFCMRRVRPNSINFRMNICIILHKNLIRD